MTNIFEDYLNIINYDICDVLNTYENLFNKLDINISIYEDDFSGWEYPETLQINCKKILIYKAQEEEILPDNLEIDDFDLDDNFAISSEVEGYRQIIEDFYNWCGIKLNIF